MDCEVISEASNQEARAKMQKIFASTVCNLMGSPCKITTYEKTNLNCLYYGWNPNGAEIIVRDLQTPSGLLLEAAIIRLIDIISIEFNKAIELA